MIRKAEEPKEQDVHASRHHHSPDVHVEQPRVLGQSVRDETETHQVQEVHVERQVDDQEEGLLRLLKHVVQTDLLLGRLGEHGGHPY